MAATHTVKQVAQILGYSTNSIYTFLKEKRISGVRVGRGRFRIPQTELDRLLMTAKGGEVSQQVATTAPIYQQLNASVGPVVRPGGVIEPVREGLLSMVYPITATRAQVEVPSLFDWFVGIGSIILGLAMFLFSRAHEEYALEAYLAWMPAIRTTLIAAGFGMLLTDVVGRKFSGWHRVFHITLIASYLSYAFILGHVYNLEGVVIYGALAAVLLITFFVAFGGIAGFSVYVISLLILLPGASMMSPTDSSITHLLSLLPIPFPLAAGIWLSAIFLLAITLWIGYQRDRWIFWLGMVVVSTILMILAINYAGLLLWGRALFTLIAGLLSLFAPIWHSLEFKFKRDRSFIFTSFGSLLVLFVVVVGVLRVMQTNILDYASRELDNKVSYGKQLVDSSFLNIKTTLVSAAANPLLVESIIKKDVKTLTELNKALFDGNSSIRRVVIVSASGEALTHYPLSVLGGTGNYASHDYFVQAMAAKRPVTSDSYELSDENSHKKVAVIAVPIITKHEVIGMIIGTVDLDTVGNKLQQIASRKTSEYFIVVDRSGNRIIHPDYTLIGTQVEESDPIRQGLTGRHAVTEGYSTDGVRTLEAYERLDDSTGWAIAIKAPIAEILKATNAASLTMVSVIIVSILMVGTFLLSHRARNPMPEAIVVAQDSPPVSVTRSKKKTYLPRAGRKDTS